VACVAPTSAAAANFAPGLKASRAEGRPPVEGASDTGTTSSSFRSGSRREVMAARPKPVIPASSALVRGRPSRRICKSSPGPPLSMSLRFVDSKGVNDETEVVTSGSQDPEGGLISPSVGCPLVSVHSSAPPASKSATLPRIPAPLASKGADFCCLSD
jgi:hypothetical protein